MEITRTITEQNLITFVSNFESCNLEEVSDICSVKRDSFYLINLQDLEALKSGEVLYDDEKGVFIMLETEDC